MPRLTQLTQSVATAEARKQSLHQEVDALMARQAALTERREQLDAQRVSRLDH